MPYSITYNQEKHCIWIIVEGELSLALLQEMARDAGKLTQQHGCKRILNDLRHARPTADTLAIYNMPKTAEQSGVGIRCKRALIVGDQADDFHFLETAFVLQGHSVKIFATLQDGEAWLFNEDKEK